MAETMREKSSIPTTAGSPGSPQAPSANPSSCVTTGASPVWLLGILRIFIRSDEAAGQIHGVSLHTCSTGTALSPDAAAGTVRAE